MVHHLNFNAAVIFMCMSFNSYAQVDTSYLYDPASKLGPLDIRIARSREEFYYLDDGRTFSFREVNGIRTNTYLDMTAWNSAPYRQGNLRLSVNNSHGFVMNYRFLKPAGYDKNYGPGYPLVLVFHGLQERGNCAGSKCYHATKDYSPNTNLPQAPTDPHSPLLNNDYNLVHGGSNYLEAFNANDSKLPDDPSLSARGFPGFVVFPQNLNGWDAASAEDAIRLVRLMIREYNIDVNRIYINGISNGGHGAYEAMLRAPWLFAAGILFSAADDASISDRGLGSEIAGIPLWIFQGGMDKKPTPRRTEGYMKHLKNAGANIRYTVYKNLGHGTWNKAFSEPDFFSWMLRQKKNNLHVYAGNAIVCKTTGEGTILSLPEGYLSYQWEHNGKILTGESDFKIVAALPGDYRGRIDVAGLPGLWSDMVHVEEKSPEPVQIFQVGTVLLKDPNGNNEAILRMDKQYAHYYWKKDGRTINLPISEGDTVKIKSTYGDGIYTLRVSDYDGCLSPPSDAKHLFFNDRAIVNIAPPADLMLAVNSPSEILVSWKEASDNENGFEIWRRRLNSQEPAVWSMRVLTGSNVISFIDKDLAPSSVYEYMVRAVSNSGRSLYTDKQSVTTLDDNESPSAPADLRVKIISTKSMRLSWRESVDNFSIKEYLIFTGNDTIRTASTDTTFVFNDYEVNREYSFYVRSLDAGDNLSEPGNTVTISTGLKGLFYEHSTGDWTTLDEIDWQLAEFTGMVDRFTLTPKTQEDFFNFRFDGYLFIEKDGVYQFRISSDDGSRLTLDDSLLIINDGIHNFATVTAPIQLLSAGPHRITVDFFDSILSDSLLVEYKGPDSGREWKPIPPERLTSHLNGPLEELEGSNFNFIVYPNPVMDDNLNIRFLNVSPSPVTISLLSDTGQEIYRENHHMDEQEQIVISDLHFLNRGFYIVRAYQNGQVKTRKIIIAK